MRVLTSTIKNILKKVIFFNMMTYLTNSCIWELKICQLSRMMIGYYMHYNYCKHSILGNINKEGENFNGS